MRAVFFRRFSSRDLRMALWTTVLLAEVAILAVRAIQHGFGQVSEDSGGYMAMAEAYRQTGALHYGPGREFPYQFLIFLVSLLFDWPDRTALAVPIALTQVALFHGVVAGFSALLWKRVGQWAVISFLALIIADWGEYKWVASIMSEAPAKIVSLAGLWCVAAFMLGGRRWHLVLGLVLLASTPLMRPQDVAVPLAGIVGTFVLASRTRSPAAFAGAARCSALLLAPMLGYVVVHGAATGVFGFSALSSNLLASRVLSVSDPERLVDAGVEPRLVRSVARPLYAGPPEVAARRDVQVNDMGQPDGVYRIVYPTPYREAAQLASGYLGPEQQGDGYAPARLLSQLARRAILSDPWPMVRSTASIAAQYALLPIQRIVKDYSIRNKAPLLFYAVLVAAPLLLLFRRRPDTDLPVGLVAAALAFLPLFWLAGAVGQNYEFRYAAHGWLVPGLLALLAIVFARSPSRMDDAARGQLG